MQFILLQGIEFGVGLLVPRRMGPWQRLRAAPLSRSVLLDSRIASAALIAFASMMAIYAAAAALFGVRISGSVPGFVGIVASFALLVPSFLFPEWLQTVSLVVPACWAVDGLDAVTWRAQGLAQVCHLAPPPSIKSIT